MSDMTLLDKARNWIDKTIPVHTRHEYHLLLCTNERLMLALLAKCMDFDNLVKTHIELENKLYADVPMMNLSVRAESCLMPMDRTVDVGLTYQMDPYRMNYRFMPHKASRFAYEEVLEALRNAFHRNFVPELWRQTEKALSGMAGAVPR
jgi:hypothetical protein